MPSSIAARANTLLLVLLVVMAAAIIAMLATRAYGGPLDPGGPPASTMKTLDDVPGSWYRRLDSTNGIASGGNAGCNSTRFKCVMDNTAVLDEETGLVWERQPATTTLDWPANVRSCLNLVLGSRLGWRLATADELLTIVSGDNNVFPLGSPFVVGDLTTSFWTATADVTTGLTTAVLPLGPNFAFEGPPTSSTRKWCVRGGQGIEGR